MYSRGCFGESSTRCMSSSPSAQGTHQADSDENLGFSESPHTGHGAGLGRESCVAGVPLIWVVQSVPLTPWGLGGTNRTAYMGHDEQLKVAFVEWSALPEQERVPRLLSEWSAEFGVPLRTLASWKKSVWFRDQLATLYAQVNVSPDRLQAVMDAMHTAAVGGNTKAAELYMRAVEAIAPRKVLIQESKAVNDMSDDELSAALKAAAAEMDKRDAESV